MNRDQFFEARQKVRMEPTGSLEDRGYGRLYQCVMRDNSLSDRSRCLYAYIASFANSTTMEAFPSQKLMCHELCWSKDTLAKYMKEIRLSGYIRVDHETDDKGKFMGCIYTILKFRGADMRGREPENIKVNESQCQLGQTINKQLLSTGNGENESINEKKPYPNLPYTENWGTNSRSIKQHEEGTSACDISIDSFYKRYIGRLTPYMKEVINSYCDVMNPNVVAVAIIRSAAANCPNQYLQTILNMWSAQGVKCEDDVKKLDEQRKQTRKGKLEKTECRPNISAYEESSKHDECELCYGSGWVVDNDGEKHPCPKCNNGGKKA